MIRRRRKLLPPKYSLISGEQTQADFNQKRDQMKFERERDSPVRKAMPVQP